MLGDVTPSQLRLIQTGTVYTGRDNKFTVTVQKYVGRSFVPADLSAVTQLLLIIPGAEPVVIDSLTYPDAFSVAGSLLTLDLSDFAFAPGTYTAQLVAFDAEHPRGQVLCETYENELTFKVRDVSATGSVPLPTLSYVEEAPANGVTYGRRDGVWVTIEAPVAVESFNGRTGGVTLLSSDVTSALGFTPLRSSDLPLLAAVATSGAYADLTGTPAIPSAPGDIGAATAAQGALADTAVQPQALADGLATKVDKVAGKQLSDENYTSAEKTKLAGLEAAHYRGTYVNLTALQAAVPTGVAGDYADVDAGVGSPVLRYIWDANDSEWVAQAGSAEPITAAQVKALYESNADTNAFSDSEKSKLAGIAAGATANTSTDTLAEGATNLYHTAARVRGVVLTGLSLATNAAVAATDTLLAAVGKLQAQITALTTTVGNKVDKVAGKQLSTEDYTTAEKDKLSGIATGATANQTDAVLLSRANHTGTQAASTISDFAEAVQDVMGATLVQGANVTIAYDDAANTITIAAASGGGTVQPWSPVATTAASATLALSNAGQYLRTTAETAVTVTVPPQSSVAWAADTEIHIEQGAAGAVTIAAGAGVTINKPTGYNAKIMGQYAVVTLKRVAADTWTLIGALEMTV